MSKKTKIGWKNNYNLLIGDIPSLLESARKTSARAVNTILTAAYWEIGRRILEYEQLGADRAEYGHQLLKNLSYDLTKKFRRGFSERNLELMRLFYLSHPISQTLSAKSLANDRIAHSPSRTSEKDNIRQTPSPQSLLTELSNRFLLPWSHYVRLFSVKDEQARKFYEAEALRSGWSVRQLDRQSENKLPQCCGNY